MVKLKLLGITALFIFAKYEDVKAPSISNYIMFENGYIKDEILNAEQHLLQTIYYKLNYSNPMNFLKCNSKADQYNIQACIVVKYLKETTLVDHAFLTCTPSITAAASLYIAMMIKKKSDQWTES
nr:2971_t:CDS:1 [Entrophospora candida]